MLLTLGNTLESPNLVMRPPTVVARYNLRGHKMINRKGLNILLVYFLVSSLYLKGESGEIADSKPLGDPNIFLLCKMMLSFT